MIDRNTEAPNDAKPGLYAGAVEKAKISIYNEDCLQALKAMADKQFDLAIVDPPYGIGASADSRVGGSYTVNLGGVKKKVAAKAYTPKDWDFSKPTIEYWNELRRVSKNQIVWGGNYFASNLEDTPCWLVWNKRNGKNNNADCELAWTSFKTAVRMFDWKWNGMLQQDMKNKEDRIRRLLSLQQTHFVDTEMQHSEHETATFSVHFLVKSLALSES